MTVLRKTSKTGAFGLCAGILALSAQCGPGVAVIHSFELSACPEEGFSLPDSVDQAPYSVKGEARKEPCKVFRLYRLREDDKELSAPYFVRFNRGQQCSLDVAYAYVGEQEKDHVEAHLEPGVEVVARLVMEGSMVAPSTPAARVKRLDFDGLQDWCNASADAAQVMCGRSRLAEASLSSRSAL